MSRRERMEVASYALRLHQPALRIDVLGILCIDASSNRLIGMLEWSFSGVLIPLIDEVTRGGAIMEFENEV